MCTLKWQALANHDDESWKGAWARWEYGDQSNTEEKPDDIERDVTAYNEKTPHVKVIQFYSRIQKLFTYLSPVRLTRNWHQNHSGSFWMGKAQSAF